MFIFLNCVSHDSAAHFILCCSCLGAVVVRALWPFCPAYALSFCHVICMLWANKWFDLIFLLFSLPQSELSDERLGSRDRVRFVSITTSMRSAPVSGRRLCLAAMSTNDRSTSYRRRQGDIHADRLYPAVQTTLLVCYKAFRSLSLTWLARLVSFIDPYCQSTCLSVCVAATLMLSGESVALLVARRTNNRKVVGSRPTKVVCITVLTGNRLWSTVRCCRPPLLLPSCRKLEFRLSALMDSDLALVNGKSVRQS